MLVDINGVTAQNHCLEASDHAKFCLFQALGAIRVKTAHSGLGRYVRITGYNGRI
jgi:hypothetical protein